MTYVANSQPTITLTANISDTIYTSISGDTNEPKVFVEIKSNGTTKMVNPIIADIDTGGAAGARTITISNIPIDTVDGIYSVTIRHTDAADADTNGNIVDIAKAIFSKVTTATTVACF